MEIITRSQAGLPDPTGILTRRTEPWAGKTWHHTGGNYTTWKAIHDWQTAGREPEDRLVYCGYSYGIANGRITELRGWDYKPAGDHENSRVQICFMGTWDTKLPPAADLAAALALDAYLDQRAGHRLPNVAHRDVWPAGHRYDTDCPGNALAAWLKTMGDDMTPAENALLFNASSITASLARMQDTAPVKETNGPNAGQAAAPIPLPLIPTVKEIAADLIELKTVVAGLAVPTPAPADAAALKAVILDPEVLAAIAKTVNDDLARRQAA